MTESLKDKIREAKKKAMADQKSRKGDEKRFKPDAGKDIHFRVLGRVDAPEPWVMKDVHYVEGPDGTKMLGCGGDDECFTCQKLDDLSKSGTKEDKKKVHRSRKQTKILLQVVDWDKRQEGPKIWEPKNTQSCSQWLNILGYIDNADFGADIYKFKTGRLITMMMTSQQKKIEGQMKPVLSLKSFQVGTKDVPVVVGKTKAGYAIQLMMKDGSKRQFPLLDLNGEIPDYDEDKHREAWGEEPEIEEEVEDVEDEESEASDEDFSDLTDDEKPKKKKKAKKPAPEEEEEEESDEDESEEEEEEEPAPKKKKAKKSAPAEDEDEFEEEEEEEPAPKKKTKKKPVEEEEEEEEDFELEDEEEEPAPKKKTKKKPKPEPEEDEEEEDESDDDFEFSEEDEEEPPKKKKGAKK